MTEQLHFHFSLSCIGEGNGNPLQCSCLESPRDGGAWWAVIYAHLLSALAAKTEGSPFHIGAQSVYRDDTAVGGNFGAFTSNRTASAVEIGRTHV